MSNVGGLGRLSVVGRWSWLTGFDAVVQQTDIGGLGVVVEAVTAYGGFR